MCGITGIYAFNMVGAFNMINLAKATENLASRGPDFQNIYNTNRIGLGHRRLSIIDTSADSNQPMWDESDTYCLIFNGEIYNYREIRTELENKGVSFSTSGDTEVLLKLLIEEGKDGLSKLNGFFAFAFFDSAKNTLLVARDRYGIKPLLYFHDEDKVIFASEMKSILAYGIEKELNYTALFQYLQLNYTAGEQTMIKGVKKLLPGHYFEVVDGNVDVNQWYQLEKDEKSVSSDYHSRKQKLLDLLDESVQRRLVADVPVGSFLSGGIDSSVVAALAAKHKPDIHTFSIGFADEPFFDETNYARSVAKKIGTDHTVFSLTNDDLYKHLSEILTYIDEPFADSSVIAVYILSKETRKHSTVALSGDGADEMLAGYNKHAAFYRMFNPGLKEQLVRSFHPLWSLLPKSRNNSITNKFRQLHRFSSAMKLEGKDRYWLLAGFIDEQEALSLFSENTLSKINHIEYECIKANVLKPLGKGSTINDVLYQDMHLVLPYDMLTKVDLMSMANSLEVRVPFLDHEVVEYVFSLPDDDKINNAGRKRILQDAFRDILPAELYNRPKKGFEVPLLKWFRKEMKGMIQDQLLEDGFIREQGIFSPVAIKNLKKRLFSSNPGDVHAQIWALIVFQTWWKRHFQ